MWVSPWDVSEFHFVDFIYLIMISRICKFYLVIMVDEESGEKEGRRETLSQERIPEPHLPERLESTLPQALSFPGKRGAFWRAMGKAG